jgi:pantothenate synthetase
VYGTCLVAPKDVREKLIPALAHAIINWTITSNQSRTFSLMETLAVSVSDNANKIACSIRAKLKEEEENKAEPIIEEEMAGVESYVTLAAGAYIRTKKETADALDKAEQALIDRMKAFDYQNQLK